MGVTPWRCSCEACSWAILRARAKGVPMLGSGRIFQGKAGSLVTRADLVDELRGQRVQLLQRQPVARAPPAVGRAAIASKAHGFMTAFPDMVVKMDKLQAICGRNRGFQALL